MSSASHPTPRKLSVGEALFTRRMLICIFTGFSSGLPLFILISLIPAWLRSEHVDLKSIGLFALIQLPYTWKFLWSPVMDRYHIAFFGRRRGWMLVTQILLLATIPAFGLFHPQQDIWSIAYLAAALAFFSASQDIVLDAYRREILSDVELGLGTSVHVNAYRIAGLVPGSLSLILADHLPWSSVYIITALFMLPGLAMALLVNEPQASRLAPKTLREAIVEPFHEFVNRAGPATALIVLAFIFAYNLGVYMAISLATAFYLDMGFSMTDIGLVAKHAALWPAVTGGLLGGICMLKTGINRALWMFGFVQTVAILGFALLTQFPQDRVALAAVIGFEAFGVGLGTSAFTAYVARTTNPLYTATQFALFTSLASVPRTIIGASAGWMVERMGWSNFYLLCAALAIPGLLLLFKVAPWNGEDSSRPKPAL